MEGPRILKPEEAPSLEELVDTVFMSGRAGEMRRIFPGMFSEGNTGNHLVFVDGGRVVSHVGMVYRWASIEGCTVRVSSIGAVATLDAYRGKGMATELVGMAQDKARAEGIDFMIISGDRTLYRRPGATRVGCDLIALIDAHAADALYSPAVHIENMAETDLPDCIAAYNQRAVHFIRPLDDWQWLVRGRASMSRDNELVVVRKAGVFQGYFVMWKPDQEGTHHVVEFAGDAGSMAAVLKPLLERSGARTIKLRLQAGDRALKALLEGAGLELRPDTTGGTLLLLNFRQLTRRLRPYFEARAGLDLAESLSFDEQDGRFIFAAGDDRLDVDKAEAVLALFGHPQKPPLHGNLGMFFPVPTLWCGINYV